jgi:PAS domain S-box-containing protein
MIKEEKRSNQPVTLAALCETDRRYRLLTDNAIDVLATTDLWGKVTFVTPSIRRLTAYESDEVIGQKIGFLLSETDTIKISKAIAEELIKEKRPKINHRRYWRADLNVKIKTGGTAPCEVRTAFLRGVDKKPIGVIMEFHDVAERVDNRQKMQRLAETNQKILDYSPIGIFLTDAFGVVEYVNEEMVGISGGPKDKLIGLNILEHKPYQEIGVVDMILSSMNSKQSFRTGVVHYKSVYGNKATDRIFGGVPIVDEVGEVDKFLLTVKDVTDLIEANSELEKFNRLMVGRELKMIELKKEIEQLKQKLKLTNKK